MIKAVDVAAEAVEELSKLERLDKARLEGLCREFMDTIKVRGGCMLPVPCLGRLQFSPHAANYADPVPMAMCLQAAQVLVQEAISAPTADRGFEATVYHSMARAHLASEKMSVVAMHLEEMRNAMQKAGRW